MSEPDLSDLYCLPGLCFMHHASRITHHVSRITHHVPVLTFQGAIAYE
jgi:hypothetical protein